MPVDTFVRVWYRRFGDLSPVELLTLLAIADTAGMSGVCSWETDADRLAFKSAQSLKDLELTINGLGRKGFLTYTHLGGDIIIDEEHLNRLGAQL
jgi:hypothetical protein